MSALTDMLTHGTWYLQAAGGGYLVPSSQANPGGDAYLTTASTRATAAKFAFRVVATTSPSSVQATVREISTNRYLAADGDDAIVLGPAPTDTSAFTVSQRRPSVLSLGWVPGSGGHGGNVGYAPAQARFTVSSAAPVAILLAIDPPAGSLLWSRQLSGAATGAAATFGGYQVVAGTAPMLTCVETFTGRIAWEFGDAMAATSPAVVSWGARAAIVASGGTVCAVSMDTAAELWSFTASSGVYARPRAFGTQIFVCASYGVLHAINASNGTEQWRFPVTGTLQGLYATPALNAGTLYLGAWDGSVYAIDAATGQQRWSFASGDKVNGVPLATNGAVFVGNDAGAVVALDPATGAELWTAATDGIVQSRPALHAAQLLAATFEGTVYGFAAASGAQVWSSKVGDPVLSDLAVVDGVAYLTTTTGKLCALTLAQTGPPVLTAVPLGGPSAGSVNVFSGTVNATTLSGIEVSFSAGLRSDVQPQDIAMLLQASDLASRVTGTAPPPLPSTWTVVGAVSATNTLGYGTALVASLRRPSDDLIVTVVAFGVVYTAFLNFYDPRRATLAALPAAIGGGSAPAGVQVTDSVLANYTSMRENLLGLIGGLPGQTLFVTGQGQGGALATLCALDLGVVKSDTPPPTSLTCVSFGSPPVGNLAFTDFFATAVQSSQRVVTPGDTTITSLPAGWAHVRTPLTLGQGFPSPLGIGTVALYAVAMAGMV